MIILLCVDLPDSRFIHGLKDKDYELIADHSYTTAMKYYQQSNEERLKNDMYSKIYCIEEIPEEKQDDFTYMKSEIEKLKKQNDYLNQKLDNVNKEYLRILEGKDFMKIVTSITEKQKRMEQIFQKFIGKKFDTVLSKQ